MRPAAVDVTQAPSVADARRAASSIALSPGVAQVLLFGSVARGDQHERSDIDLLVVFDDLDYAERGRVEMTLEGLAGVAAGRACDVHATDLPEWWNRQKVSSSFERAIAGEAVCLVSNEPGAINWNKEMVRPMSNEQEALEQLKSVTRMVEALERSAFASQSSREGRHEDWGLDAELLEEYQEEKHLGRMCSVCADSSMLIELSAKSFVVLHGEHPVREADLQNIGHNIEKALEQIESPISDRIREAIARSGIPMETISSWRVRETYIGREFKNKIYPTQEDLEQHADEQVDKYVHLSLSVAFTALEEVGRAVEKEPTATKILGSLKIALTDMSSQFKSTDVRSGGPLPGGTRAVDPPQPLPKAESETDAALSEMDDMVRGLESAGPQPLAQPSQRQACGEWMKRAEAHCVLGRGHKGSHRSHL